jgi:hypothetical protein
MGALSGQHNNAGPQSMRRPAFMISPFAAYCLLLKADLLGAKGKLAAWGGSIY